MPKGTPVSFNKENHVVLNSIRKCDRKLPGCTECKLKGKECNYPEPMKRGPPKTATATHSGYQSSSSSSPTNNSDQQQKTKPRHAPYITRSLDVQQENQEQPISFQTVDLYFDIVSLGCPILQRQTMVSIINKPTDQEKRSEEVALMYAIQANCYQRLGKKEEGKRAFSHARQYLSQVFDLLDNFAIAGTFLYLAIYCLGEGSHNLSRYYLNSVQFYVVQNKAILKDNDYFVHLCKLLLYTQLLLEEEETLCALEAQTDHNHVISSDGYTMQVYHFKKMIDIFVFVTQSISDGSCGKGIPVQYSETLANMTNESTESIMKHLVFIENARSQFSRVEPEQPGGAVKNLTKVMYLLIIDGIRLAILARSPAPSDSVIIETANRISNTSTLPMFPYMPSHLHLVIGNAARIHLSVVKQIQRGERPCGDINFYEYLKKDLRALVLLAERFTIVEKRQQALIDEISEVLIRKEQQNELISNIQQQTMNYQNIIAAAVSELSKTPDLAVLPETAEHELEQLIFDTATEVGRPLPNDTTIDELLAGPLNVQVPEDFSEQGDPFSAVMQDNFDFDMFKTPTTDNYYADNSHLLNDRTLQ